MDFARFALIDIGEHPDGFRIDQRENRLSRAKRGTKLLLARGHHGVVGRREGVKIQCCGFLLLLRLGVADGGARHRNLGVCQIHIGKRGILNCLGRLRCLDRCNVALDQFLSTLVDALGIGIVGLGLFDARRGLLKIGLGLLNARSWPCRTRALCSRSSRRASTAPLATRSPTSARRSTRTPDTLNPTLDVTRASTVPRPKTWTATLDSRCETFTLTG